MSKLIYSPTSALLEGTYDNIKNIDLAVNPVFYSIAFTGDGFMYTHGKKFRLFNVLNEGIEGFSFQILNGIAGVYIDGTSIGSGNVILSVTGDNIINVTTTNGEVSLSHTSFFQQSDTFGSATLIPIITVDTYGHISAISNSGTIDVSKLRAEATTTTGYYYPIGVTNNTLQNPLYNTNLFFDENGAIYALNIYIGNSALSTLYAPLTHISAYADDSTYGHVLLSDTPDIESDTGEHIAATPKAVASGILTANQYSLDLFAALDAMVFVGTITSDGTITSHNSIILPDAIDNTTNLTYLNYKVGWTFRFVEAGTFNGEDVEVGDMLIAVHPKDTNFSINDWTVIQTNISGALTASSTLNGLLYANNSRVVNSLAFLTGVLKYDGQLLRFVNLNTLWRDIQIDSNSIGTNVLNLLAGTAISISETNGEVTIGVDSSSIILASAALTLELDLVSFSYRPTAAATLTIGDKLTLEKDEQDNYTLKHASGQTFTNKLGQITTDSYGHVTAISEVSSLQNPYALVLKVNNDTIAEYLGNTEKTIMFKSGGDIVFSSSTDANNNIIIEGEVTHKYRGVQFFTNSSSNTAIPLLANNVNTILTLVGGNNVSLAKVNSSGEDLPAGTLMINAEDTWRNIEAYKFLSNVFSRSSIGSSQLNFGSDFIMTNTELGITWMEIDEDGRVTYVS